MFESVVKVNNTLYNNSFLSVQNCGSASIFNIHKSLFKTICFKCKQTIVFSFEQSASGSYEINGFACRHSRR